MDYVDRKAMLAHPAGEEAYLKERSELLNKSCLVYVGNLSFWTLESQILALFSAVGEVSAIVMGLDRQHRTPCGFCFVEFEDHVSAGRAVTLLNKARLDDRKISVSWDPEPLGAAGVVARGRFWGRGVSGGQTRDELREDLDPGRGGLGLRRSLELGVDKVAVREEVSSQLVHYSWVPPPPIPRALAGKKRERA